MIHTPLVNYELTRERD